MDYNSFIIDDYTFKSYVDCSKEELLLILHWRNDDNIRIWMDNDRPITEFDHLNFVKGLRNDSGKIYFAVFKDNVYIASIYVTDITKDSGERGIYVLPSYQGKGTSQNIEKAFIKKIREKGFQFFIAKVKIENIRSIKYHIKMGYKEIFRDKSYIHYKLDFVNIKD